ncbi:MAG TPA: porin family protein [Acidobacteriota bacterium]|nr:porin family protein [Acidobacteriota bacterium]
MRAIKRSILSGSLVLLIAVLCPLRAEDEPGIRLGIKAGPCFSTVRWSMPMLEGSVSGTETHRKLTVGFLAEIGLSPRFAVQPELDFLTTVRTWTPPLGQGIFTDTLQYLQVPILFKMKLTRGGWVVPAVFAGPCLSVLLKARDTFYDVFTGQYYYADIKDLYRDFDLGAAAGAEVNVKVRNLRLILDVRYYMGLIDVERAADSSWKNSGLMITAGLGF